MTYTIKFSSNKKRPFTIDAYRYDGAGSNDGHHTSLTLVGQGSSDYGEELWTNLVHMLENHCSITEPSKPIEGQLWYDNSFNGTLKLLKKSNPSDSPAKWVELVDKESLRDYLRDPEFYPISRLAKNVYVPRVGSTIHGILKVNGKIDGWDGIKSRKAPVESNDVVTLGYLNHEIIKFNGKYLPLNIETAGATVNTGMQTLSISGNISISGVTTVSDPVQGSDAVNLRSLQSELRKTGFSWPKQEINTVLTTDGSTPRFTDITPDYICKTQKVTSIENEYNIIASSLSKNTAYWYNLDNDYVYAQNKNKTAADQIIHAPKTFKKITLDGPLYDGATISSPGVLGQVLTSQGPGRAPTWGTAGGGGGTPATEEDTSSSGTGKGVLTSDGTNTNWVDGNLGQFLSVTGTNIYNWVDIISKIVQNDQAGDATSGYFTRGYIKLPNDMVVQWIKGKPLFDDATIDPAPKVTNWRSFATNTGDFCFYPVQASTIACRYKFEIPFESVYFSTISTSMQANTDVSPISVDSDGSYRLLEIGSSNTHTAMVLNYTTLKKNRPFLSPTVFALGKLPDPNAVPDVVVTINISSTWTVPAGVTSITIAAVGGGAGGGSGYANDNWNGAGGGGGSGGYSVLKDVKVSAGETLTMVVGKGGAGGLPGGSKTPLAGIGGITKVQRGTEDLIVVTGGINPLHTSYEHSNIGGLGGTPNGIQGATGKASKNNSADSADAGHGGDCPIPYTPGLYGGGGAAGVKKSGKDGPQNGGNGEGYGAGGGGASVRAKGSGAGTGGNGANGVVIITYKA